VNSLRPQSLFQQLSTLLGNRFPTQEKNQTSTNKYQPLPTPTNTYQQRPSTMVCAASFVFASMLALTVTARPIPCDSDDSAPADITAEQLNKIDPTTATCAPTGENAAECADAARAAPAINASFKKYAITTPGEQAALIALIDFESVGFKYNKNHFSPDGPRPGQGTRNMQMLPFNIQYAKDVLPAATASAAEAAGGDAVTAALNADDAVSFGSAAWFLTKAQPDKCTQQIRDGLAAGTKLGWDAYLTQCVETTAVPARDVPWLAAKAALGVTAV
jgi:hypothetical protein